MRTRFNAETQRRRENHCFSSASLRLCVKIALLALPLAAADDPILQAMRDELARSRTLQVAGLDRPYFIEYSLEDADTFSASATAGGLVSTRRERFRAPEIRVRVGDYAFDNTNYIGSGYGFGPRYNDRFPLDNLYPAIRRFLWLETDGAYKSALETLSRKRAALRNVAVNAELNDFARAEPLKLLRPAGRESVSVPAWLARVRSLSALLAAPALKYTSLELESIQTDRYYVNSEGAEVRVPESAVFLRARALAQAPDGMTVRDADVFHAAAFSGLPSDAEFARRLSALAGNTAALAVAPRGEDYSGPVLFEGVAAAQLFAEMLGRNFAPSRRPVAEPGRPAAFPYSELEGRHGARILPEWMDVVDDSTQQEFRGRPLFGHYAVDREGVVPRRVPLVEKGVLKNFLLTRQPVRGFEGSNGHARLPGSYGASAATIGNLFVRAAETVSLADLKRKLIEICDARGKPYGILVRKMDFPSSASYEEIRRLLAGSQSGSARPVSMPILVYKVFPDGREELVRGLRFRGLNARSFKDILAAGDDETIFDFLNNNAPFALMGAGGYMAETTVVAPSILIDDLELHPAEDELPKLPLVPPPPASRHGDTATRRRGDPPSARHGDPSARSADTTPAPGPRPLAPARSAPSPGPQPLAPARSAPAPEARSAS